MTKPIFNVSAGESLSVTGLAREAAISVEVALQELSSLFEEAARTFGVRPFSLEYSRSGGWCVRAGAQVGWLGSQSFILELLPKFDGLSNAKILSLALSSEMGSLHVGQRFLAAHGIQSDDLSTREMLCLSFLDALEETLRQGLQQVAVLKNSDSAKRFDSIVLEDWVQLGTVPPPPVRSMLSSADTPSNRVLLAALGEVLQLEISPQIQALASRLQGMLEGVSELTPEQYAHPSQIVDLTMPRADYERSVGLAFAVLEREVVVSLGGRGESPEFLVDLDSLFEQLCFDHLTRNLDENVFSVAFQATFEHPIEPAIPGSIVPDIVVTHRATGKCIVIDAKNKVSAREGFAANADIYQLTYYSRALNAEASLLVFPTTRPNWQFPVKSSSVSGEQFRATALAMVANDADLWHSVFPGPNPIRVGRYEIDLAGSQRNTDLSFASLSYLIATVLVP